MSPENPDSSRKKDKERRGGAASFWSGAAPQQPPDFPALPEPPGPKPASKLPSFSVFGKGRQAGIPMLAGKGGGTLIGRLRNLRSKEIVFIVAGLGVLILAPIAEHMISSPDDQGGTLTQGFDQKGAGLGLGTENPYEPGIISLAQGHLPGQGTEVVTPLNVRDPSSLIMSPGGEEKKAPPPAVTPPPGPAKPDTGWTDALASAASKGVKKATEKVSLPMPGGKLNKLPSLSGGGGSGAALNLAAPSSKGLFSTPGSGGSLRAAPPGYRGGDRRSLSGGAAPMSFGGGRTSPGGAGGPMSWDGGPGGPGGVYSGPPGGSPRGGDADKAGGGSGHEGNKNVGINQKEDLAWLRRKMEMEKAVDLKWAKKKYDQLERKKMLEELAAQTAQQAFLKILDKLLGGGKGGGKDEKKADDGGKPDGGKPDGGKPDGGKPDSGGPSGPGGPGGTKPAPEGPGTEPRPKPVPSGQTFRADLSRLEAADRDVQGSVGAMGTDPPAAGAAPRMAGLDQIKTKENNIAQADAKLGEGVTELGRMTTANLKTVDPSIQYPAIPEGVSAEDRKRLEKQRASFEQMMKQSSDSGVAVKAANDRIIAQRGELEGMRSPTQAAFIDAQKATLEARAKAIEAKTAVETANAALKQLAQGSGSVEAADAAIADARKAQEALTSAVAAAREKITAAEGSQKELKTKSTDMTQIRQRYDTGMTQLSTYWQALETRAKLLAQSRDGFDKQIAPKIAAEAQAATQNRESFTGSQQAAKKGGGLVSTSSTLYEGLMGTAR